ncbi:hypothetical protein PoB_006306300 [Plakobranchus ocellatus]|uniref:Uncharacterized protein n=1 Tax=Plakobranchus ocellatus TaxID=259542 RepID=A0AAV4CXD0_9GAST|nr:hypothetical protein PoB_006306300 [Plakobranchus ocellatus]
MAACFQEIPDSCGALAMGFNDHHGENVRLPDLTTAVHDYWKAQGLFTLDKPLTKATTFRLHFYKPGVVKIHAVKNKATALHWIMNRHPLPKGCIRVKNEHSFILEVNFTGPNVFQFVYKDYRKEMRGVHLLFDIEYGDVCITALSESSEVTFDRNNHSPYIAISWSDGFTSATLTHFNPLGLCRLLSTVKRGQNYRLQVTGNRGYPGKGPYFRLWAVRSSHRYRDVSNLLCFDTNELVDGGIVWVNVGENKVLILKLRSPQVGLHRQMSSSSSSALEMFLPDPGGFFLWCELHKVSLRVFRIQDPAQSQPAPESELYYDITGLKQLFSADLQMPSEQTELKSLTVSSTPRYNEYETAREILQKHQPSDTGNLLTNEDTPGHTSPDPAQSQPAPESELYNDITGLKQLFSADLQMPSEQTRLKSLTVSSIPRYNVHETAREILPQHQSSDTGHLLTNGDTPGHTYSTFSTLTMCNSPVENLPEVSEISARDADSSNTYFVSHLSGSECCATSTSNNATDSVDPDNISDQIEDLKLQPFS